MTSYIIPHGIAYKQLKEEIFFLTPRSSEMHTLDAMGSTMLNLILDGKSPEEVGLLLSEEYDAPAERITSDVTTLLRDLIERGLLRESDSGE